MNLNWLGRVGQIFATNTIVGTFSGSLIAKWNQMPAGVTTTYDDAQGVYIDTATGVAVITIPMTLSIPAYFDEAPNIKYKYQDYGVDPSVDAIALIPVSFALPDSTATYYRAGQMDKPYKLLGLIQKADIGISGPGAIPDVAYKVLHLRQN